MSETLIRMEFLLSLFDKRNPEIKKYKKSMKFKKYLKNLIIHYATNCKKVLSCRKFQFFHLRFCGLSFE